MAQATKRDLQMVRKMPAQISAEFGRIKREECKRTKHDSQFSKWKDLVGPSDWEDYFLGKEGAARYRVHNLPTTAGPGLYELGVAAHCNALGRDIGKLDSDGVVVVYLGQADSVRTRLQHYGRTGDHLNNPNDCGLETVPGYFEDIFKRGFSIVYRWVPMKTKADALETENQLLKKFDYAWNKVNNGTRRHDDVLLKVNNKVASCNFQLPKAVKKLLSFTQKPEGIKIKGSKLLAQGNKFSSYTDEEGHNLFSQVFKFSKFRPRLVLDRCAADEDYTSVCGVFLGDGSVCRRPPVEGRKRCAQHRGLRINGLVPKSTSEGKSKVGSAYSKTSTSVNRECDVHDEHDFSFVPEKLPVVSGSFSPIGGEIYKAGRVQSTVFSERSTVNLQYGNTICGVELGNGLFCTRQPVTGRLRCEEHKGLTVDGLISKSGAKDKCYGDDIRSKFSTYDDRKYRTSVCGAPTLSGSYCKRPVNGETRCWQHLRASDTRWTISTYNEGNSGRSSVCGAPTRNGSYCRRVVKGGGTCWQH